MEYRRLGNSGLKVSEIGLGGNNFGWYADEATSISVIQHAIGLGINLIDTADMYGRGQSEEYVGKGVKGKRQDVIIATKLGFAMEEAPNQGGASRYYLVRAVEASLKRLQTDYIDLYYIHFPDPLTPLEETLRALDDLVRSGKVRYIGCSNFPAWQVCESLWLSRTNNLHSFIVAQARYNMLERQIEAEFVPCCRAHGMGVIPWGPLAGGFLTGKYDKGKDAPAGARLAAPNKLYGGMFTDANWSKMVKLRAFAAERGHTVAELALAWLLAKPWISSVIAGAKQPSQISANMAAASWKLIPREVAELDGI